MGSYSKNLKPFSGNFKGIFCIGTVVIFLFSFVMTSCSKSFSRGAGATAAITYVVHTVVTDSTKIKELFSKESRWASLKKGDSMFVVWDKVGEPNYRKEFSTNRLEWIYIMKNGERRSIGFVDGFLTYVKVEIPKK